jgi:hypothetical protein
MTSTQGRPNEETEMNWAPDVVVRVEMDYRIERARTDRGTTFEHLRAAQRTHQSWWRRHLANHDTHHDERAA